jgi:hypothetical protein
LSLMSQIPVFVDFCPADTGGAEECRRVKCGRSRGQTKGWEGRKEGGKGMKRENEIRKPAPFNNRVCHASDFR